MTSLGASRGTQPQQREGRVQIPVPREQGSAGLHEPQGTRHNLCMAHHTLTYGPEDSVEGAHVLLVRTVVLPGNLELAIWQPPDA